MTQKRQKVIKMMLVALHVYDRRMDDAVRTALIQGIKELVGTGKVEVLVNAGFDRMTADKTGIDIRSAK